MCVHRHFAALCISAALLPGAALAGPSVVNGNFSQTTYTTNSQFGTPFGGQGVTGWTGGGGYQLFFFNGKATTQSANSQYDNGAGTGSEDLWGTSNFNGSSPVGYNFVALDGDPQVNNAGGGSISQTINGLTVGMSYAVTFQWAASQLQSRTGNTTDYLAVSLGGQTRDTATVSNVSQGFNGWFDQTFGFTATSISEVLQFVNNGTPSGAPPIALLTDVAITQVPEPASLVLLGSGLVVAWRVRRARQSR